MGLDQLLARMEGRSVTPVTPGHGGRVTEKPLTKQACYTVTPVTPENAEGSSLWWRVAITEPGDRTIEVDTPSGWILADWQANADRYHGPGCAVTPLVPLPKPRAPVTLDEALRSACEGVAGITPAQFRALMSPEDLADTEAGAIHTKTLHAYALSFAEGIRSGRLFSAVTP